MSFVLHINGMPGSGKFTIGKVLANRLGAALLDNHTLIDPAEALLGRDHPQFRLLRMELRELVFRHALAAAMAKPIIFTGALAVGEDEEFVDCAELARRLNLAFFSCTLDISYEENLRRLHAEERIGTKKLVDASVLEELRRLELLRPLGVPHIFIDVSNLDAKCAASKIEIWVFESMAIQ